MYPVRRLFVAATCAASLALVPLSGAHAQSSETTYGTWSPPGTASGTYNDAQLQALLKELNAMIAKAEKARAADSVFLRDLKALAARYQAPTAQQLLFDDFSDGDFQRNPVWSVTSGEYWVERGYGLRSKVVDVAAASNNTATSGKISKEQLAISVLGALLNGANKNAPAPAAEPQPAASVDRASAIESRTRISNAFSATVELSSWNADGAFEVAVTQGLAGAGYRVAYTAGQNARLELVKVTSRGRGTVDSRPLASLEDQKIHSLNWARTADGSMTVSVDGKVVLSARDTSFLDPFDALQLSSAGADVIVKSVQVMGAK